MDRFEELRHRAKAGVERIVAARTAPELPLSYWRQQAHFTTPASDLAMATKAAEQGFAPALRMFEKYGISRDDLAAAFQVARAEIDAVADGPREAPLVLIDGEDAQALDDVQVVLRGRQNAVQVFREAKWGSSLRFWRPSGLLLGYSTDDLVDVLTGVAAGRDPTSFAIDGVTWPKAERPDELVWLCELLTGIEKAAGLPENRIRVQFLVESAESVLNLGALVNAAGPRLCGIVYGIADHAAELGLPEIRNDHPSSDFARIAVVHAAAAASVPAIDAMTLEYPVADATLSVDGNRARILSRLVRCFEDARHGLMLGMSGKWVGHPAQLFACLVAYRSALSASRIEEELRRVEAYRASVAGEKGATIIGGLMTDRANDRHSRTLLRRAVAAGRLDFDKALSLGIVRASERP